MSINVDRHPRKVHLKMNCVKDDMRIKGMNMDMTSDRREWKKKTCADPTLTLWDKGTMMIMSIISLSNPQTNSFVWTMSFCECHIQ
jgi:hypothetical protein